MSPVLAAWRGQDGQALQAIEAGSETLNDRTLFKRAGVRIR